LQVSQCFKEDFMKRLSVAVKKEINAFERNSQIQTITLADAGEALPAAEEREEAHKKRRASNKEDEDENAEENDEFDEGKLRFAGACITPPPPPFPVRALFGLEIECFDKKRRSLACKVLLHGLSVQRGRGKKGGGGGAGGGGDGVELLFTHLPR